MATIEVFLESGFRHDRVDVRAAGGRHEEHDVTTRYQIGLAAVVELTVPDGEPSIVRVALADRGISSEVEVDPGRTPYLRVNAVEDALTIQPESAPPMYA